MGFVRAGSLILFSRSFALSGGGGVARRTAPSPQLQAGELSPSIELSFNVPGGRTLVGHPPARFTSGVLLWWWRSHVARHCVGNFSSSPSLLFSNAPPFWRIMERGLSPQIHRSVREQQQSHFAAGGVAVVGWGPFHRPCSTPLCDHVRHNDPARQEGMSRQSSSRRCPNKQA